MAVLRKELLTSLRTRMGNVCPYREFTEREPNTVWAERLWQWLASTGADWCLQLQDDVEVAPELLARTPSHATESTPARKAGIVGLTSVHPLASLEVARRGRAVVPHAKPARWMGVCDAHARRCRRSLRGG